MLPGDIKSKVTDEIKNVEVLHSMGNERRCGGVHTMPRGTDDGGKSRR